MKKSKLLIPALSIASVGAIVTPIITSCSKGIEMIDATVAYTPTIAAYTPTSEEEESGVKLDRAKEIYLDAAVKNYEIVKQDFFCGICGNLGTKFTEAKIGMKINQITNDGKLNGEVALVMKQSTTSESTTIQSDLTISFNLQNVQMGPAVKSSQFIWRIIQDGYASWQNDCKVIVKGNGYIKVTESEETTETKFDNTEITVDNSFDPSSKTMTDQQKYLATLIEIFGFPSPSNYLSKLKPAK